MSLKTHVSVDNIYTLQRQKLLQPQRTIKLYLLLSQSQLSNLDHLQLKHIFSHFITIIKTYIIHSHHTALALLLI